MMRSFIAAFVCLSHSLSFVSSPFFSHRDCLKAVSLYASPLHLLTTVVYIYSASDYSSLTLSPLCLPFLSTTPLLPLSPSPKFITFGFVWGLTGTWWSHKGIQNTQVLAAMDLPFPWISSKHLISKWKGLVRTYCSHTSDCLEPFKHPPLLWVQCWPLPSI